MTFVDINTGRAPAGQEKAFPSVEEWIEEVYQALVRLEARVGAKIPILAKGAQMEEDILVNGHYTSGDCQAFFRDRLRDEVDAWQFEEMEISDEGRWQSTCNERELLSWVVGWQIRSETKRWCPYHRLAHPNSHCALGDCVLGVARLRWMHQRGVSDERVKAAVETARRVMAMDPREWAALDLLNANPRGLLPAAQVVDTMQAPAVPGAATSGMRSNGITVANTTWYKFATSEGVMAVLEGTKGVLLNPAGAMTHGSPIWTAKRSLKRMFPSLVVSEETMVDPETIVNVATKGRVPLVSHLQAAWPSNAMIANLGAHQEWVRQFPRARGVQWLRVCANSRLGGGQSWAFIPREWGLKRIGPVIPRELERAWTRRSRECVEPACPEGISCGPIPAPARADSAFSMQFGVKSDNLSTVKALGDAMTSITDWWKTNPLRSAPRQDPAPRAAPEARQAPTLWGRGRQLETPAEERAKRSEGGTPRGGQGQASVFEVAREEDSLVDGQGKRARRLEDMEALKTVVKAMEEHEKKEGATIERMEAQVKEHAAAAAAIKDGMEKLMATQTVGQETAETVRLLRVALEDARREAVELRMQLRMQQSMMTMMMGPQAGMYGGPQFGGPAGQPMQGQMGVFPMGQTMIGPGAGGQVGRRPQGQAGSPLAQGAGQYGQNQAQPPLAHPSGAASRQEGQGQRGQMGTPPAGGRDEGWQGDGRPGAPGTGNRWG